MPRRKVEEDGSQVSKAQAGYLPTGTTQGTTQALVKQWGPGRGKRGEGGRRRGEESRGEGGESCAPKKEKRKKKKKKKGKYITCTTQTQLTFLKKKILPFVFFFLSSPFDFFFFGALALSHSF